MYMLYNIYKYYIASALPAFESRISQSLVSFIKKKIESCEVDNFCGL